MLAEWPDSISELAINESAAVLAEHATNKKFNELSHEEVKLKIANVVYETAVRLTAFKNHAAQHEDHARCCGPER